MAVLEEMTARIKFGDLLIDWPKAVIKNSFIQLGG